MITVVDSNLFIALWTIDDALNLPAQAALEGASSRGRLVVPAPVYAELLAGPGRTEKFLDEFFAHAGIEIDWNLGREVWRKAGRAFQSYISGRPRERGAHPRRILADFIIGAYASSNGYCLLTLDDRHFRTAFPEVTLIKI